MVEVLFCLLFLAMACYPAVAVSLSPPPLSTIISTTPEGCCVRTLPCVWLFDSQLFMRCPDHHLVFRFEQLSTDLFPPLSYWAFPVSRYSSDACCLSTRFSQLQDAPFRRTRISSFIRLSYFFSWSSNSPFLVLDQVADPSPMPIIFQFFLSIVRAVVGSPFFPLWN